MANEVGVVFCLAKMRRDQIILRFFVENMLIDRIVVATGCLSHPWYKWLLRFCALAFKSSHHGVNIVYFRDTRGVCDLEFIC